MTPFVYLWPFQAALSQADALRNLFPHAHVSSTILVEVYKSQQRQVPVPLAHKLLGSRCPSALLAVEPFHQYE